MDQEKDDQTQAHNDVIIQQSSLSIPESSNTPEQTVVVPEEKSRLIILSYGGNKGDKIVKSMKKDLKKVLPTHIRTRIAYTYTGRARYHAPSYM